MDLSIYLSIAVIVEYNVVIHTPVSHKNIYLGINLEQTLLNVGRISRLPNTHVLYTTFLSGLNASKT